MEEANVKLSSPWESVHHILAALFADDKDILVGEIDDSYVLTITVYNYDKFQALNRILKQEFKFGNVTLKIVLLNAVDEVEHTYTEDLVTIFNGNPFFSRVEVIKDFRGIEQGYCMFAKKVLQYFNDDITNPNGIQSKLVQDVALDLFVSEAGINFTTETEEPLKEEDQ